jgi:serine/threonine protein kinase/tetratricopeptide (TPR) repeat protein
MIGKRVSHYEVIRPLGAGGMGVVYEAEDTQLGRRVALKFLPKDLSGDPASLERFQREARAASALNHPNICTVYAIGQHEGEHFIAMELLEGESLAQGLAGRRFGIGEVVDAGIQIADALESAHAKGIVHRDIKPGNLFLNARNQVKVLDFGLAKFDTGGPAARSGSRSTDETVAARQDLTTPGTAMGTVSYMSPEQARGQFTDARSDLFSLGTVLYQMATGALPFQGETSAVIFDAILNRDPAPAHQANPAVPDELGRVVAKALEKDRNLRCQSATELKTDLLRIKRDLDSGGRRAAESGKRTAESGESRSAPAKAPDRSIAVLYFENLSGVKEDEYFRDGITEDIITELSKIKGLNIFSRPTVLAYRDKPVTPAQIGQQLGAAHVLTGSLRRAGNRLRINAQLIDTRTDFPLWSERYDREMADVFEVQDEIARKIAEALRVTLSPQEKAALAAKPTDNLQAYDLYLRGKSYARRLTKHDLQFALQMFENAVAQDPNFALARAALANVCALYFVNYERETSWMERALAAAQKASALQPELPEVQVSEAWMFYAEKKFEEAIQRVRRAIAVKPDCEGAYYLLGRALFAAGRYQEVANIAEAAVAAGGEDYNVYVPILNALGALGKEEMRRSFRQRRIQVLENQLRNVPEDVRARVLIASDYAKSGRGDDALREANLAMALLPNEGTILYNVACVFCQLGKTAEGLAALSKAWEAGWKDVEWTRNDPDLSTLHGEPEFERMYAEKT